jgi:hypothetical protein
MDAAVARAVKADNSAWLLFIAILATIGDMGLTVRGEAVAGGWTKSSSSDSVFSLSLEA